MSRLLARAWLAVLLVLAASPVASHELSMAEMRLRETAAGVFTWAWTGGDKRPPGDVLEPRWPDGCVAEETTLRCGPAGLDGRLSVRGVGDAYSAVLVRIRWLDGQTRVHTLTAAQPAVRLFGSADDRRGWGEIAATYGVLGVEHILGGIDHLLFVVGLLFLVGFRRQLLWTVTAFTAAHSLTLASASLGWLVLPPAPVEACIALSIVLVADEALRRRDSLARRWPALVAFCFGLLHGLGFAGALSEIGLPKDHLPMALLSFNVGVEIGQLFAIGVAWAVWRLARRWPHLDRLRRIALYAIGSLAAFWTWSRVAAIVG